MKSVSALPKFITPRNPQDLWCTFSAGVVELCESSDSLMMASQADEALYRAKHAGRNRVQARAHIKAKCHFFIGIDRFGHNPVTETQ